MRMIAIRGIKGLALASAVMLVVGLTACGGSSGPPEEVAQGMELFRGTCATCHGQDARGMPKLGKDLHDNDFIKGMNDIELATFFREGRLANHPDNEAKVDMPPKGGNPLLNDEDMRLIAVYVRSIQ